MMQIHFVSLGCPKNLVDSEVMLGDLARRGWRLAEKPEQADAIVINTCGFIQTSKEESISTILELARYKKIGVCRALVACGCLAQRYPEQLADELPELDAVVGTGEYPRLAEILDQIFSRSSRTGALRAVAEPTFIHDESHPRLHTGASYLGYLKISEGCDRRCSFCIIPEIRGKVRSRSVESLVQEARGMAEAGVRELSLVAQDLTEYGKDTHYQENLQALLPALAAIDGLRWIRLHYAYPDNFPDELVDIIAREPKIVKYLDIPLQHTNDSVLRGMNRRLKKERIFALINRLRERVPGIVLRTSIIVGFPGETEEHFDELCADLRELNLDHVGVFAYSREDGTKAACMEGQVHVATRRRREQRLLEAIERQSHARLQGWVGQKVSVLIEGPSDETELLIQSRMPGQAAGIDGHVLINDIPADLAPSELRPGRFAEVEITEAMPHDLVGRLLSLEP